MWTVISRSHQRLNLLLAMVFLMGWQGGCKSLAWEGSEVQTSSTIQSPVKSQPLSNCWIYAFAAWLESLGMQVGQTDINVSESYWLYWSFYDQITGDAAIESVDDHGSWVLARELVHKYGYADEKDFYDDINAEYSIGKEAFAFINQDLAHGALAQAGARQDKDLVKSRLNAAFKLAPGKIDQMRKDARQLMLRGRLDGRAVSLMDLLYAPGSAFVQVRYPDRPLATKAVDAETRSRRDKILRVVKAALNEHLPVVMSFTNDHTSLDTSRNIYKYDGPSGEKTASGGGHQVTLEDYVTIGGPAEGEASASEKAKALDQELDYFLAKNSWGEGWGDKGHLRYARSFIDGYPKRVDENGHVTQFTNGDAFIVPQALMGSFAQVVKQIYKTSESVEIVFSDFSGYSGDWLAVYRTAHGTATEVFRADTEGAYSGRVTVGKLPAGSYELRAGYNGLGAYFLRSSFTVEKAGLF